MSGLGTDEGWGVLAGVVQSVTQASGQAVPQVRQMCAVSVRPSPVSTSAAVDVEGAAVGADRLVVDDPEHRSPRLTPAGGVGADQPGEMAASRAWAVIHASAQALWQGTSLTGDRQNAGVPQSTQGASGPMLPRRQSRTTRSGHGAGSVGHAEVSFSFAR